MLCPRISCLLLTVAALAFPLAAQTETDAAPRTSATCRSLPPVTQQAERTAQEIGVTTQVQRLRMLWEQCDQSNAVTIEEIALRQQITVAVTMTALDVDSVIAEIDNERSQILEERDALSSARDRRINILSVANIVTGGASGILTNAMQFSASTALAGDAIGIGGGAAGVMLSILGLRVQGPKAPLAASPRMLAPLLQPGSDTSAYPPEVWSFLNTPGESGISERDKLINEWVQEKRIGPPSAPASQKKIDLLSSGQEQHKALPIGALTDRSVMLLHVRVQVALMNRDLGTLLRDVSNLHSGN